MDKFRDLISRVEKEFGKEAIVQEIKEVERISSGCLSLDLALGGGYAVGRLIEIFGWESSGKTTLALHLAAEVQKKGGRVGYIDTEHSLDLFYAAALGVDVDIEAEDAKFVLSQPSSGEEAIEIARMFTGSGLFELVVIDSVASLVPKAVIQGKAGDQKIGLIARLMSQLVPTLVAPAQQNNCTICFINQFREKIGVMFGSPTTTSGGNALKFYTSQRIEVSRIGGVKTKNDEGDEELTANKVKVKVKKNKVSPPFKEAEFQIVFGEGINYHADVIEIGVSLGFVQKSGSWFSFDGTKGQGFESFVDMLREDVGEFEKLETKVKEECGIL